MMMFSESRKIVSPRIGVDMIRYQGDSSEVLMAKNYWMITVRPDEFALIRGNGFRHHSMRASHKRKVQRIEPGDQILFYILERQYFGATAVVNSRNFKDVDNNRKKGTEEGWDFVIHLDPNSGGIFEFSYSTDMSVDDLKKYAAEAEVRRLKQLNL